MGVDGLRLDAIPYLIEREGTNNENLPETHVVLKAIRKPSSTRITPNRMLLAEANQWPEDTRIYFGDGDECHMAISFPADAAHVHGRSRKRGPASRSPTSSARRRTFPKTAQWGDLPAQS